MGLRDSNTCQFYRQRRGQSLEAAAPLSCPGDLRPLGNHEILKILIWALFENRIWHFSKIFWKMGYVFKIFWKIPLAPPPAAPPGRCRALGRGYFFQNILKTYPNFQNILKIYQILFSKRAQIRIFKISGFPKGRRMPSRIQGPGSRRECENCIGPINGINRENRRENQKSNKKSAFAL